MRDREKSGRKAERGHARLKRIFAVLMRIVRPVAKRKFNLSYETLDNVEGPYLVLSNHTTDWDCIFVGLASTRQLYFVATEKLARMGFGGRLVRWLFDPILHYKGRQGTNTIKAVYRHIQQGHNVAMFPEGNRSFNGETCPIPPATGKMARMCGGTLVTYRWTGGYFSSPRWGEGIRKGRIEGHIAGVYTHEQLQAMSDDEIRETIERDLYVNAYEEQERERVAFKGRHTAEGLESMLFMCPLCRKIGTLHSISSYVMCDNPKCSMNAEYDRYGYLRQDMGPGDETQKNAGVSWKLSELDRAQRQQVESIYGQTECARDKSAGAENADSEEMIFSDDDISRETIDSSHRLVERVKTRIAAYRDRLEIGDVVVPFEKIDGLAINQRNLLIIHLRDSDVHYECDGPKQFSALKYLYLCRAAKSSVNGIL